MSADDYDWKKIGTFFSLLLILIGGIVGAASGIYYKNKLDTAEKRIREVSVASEVDVSALVAKVGKLIKLPEGEMPTIATVTDLARLQKQPFFAKAKVGDKVLIYALAKKAFLYDPINNVIVEVGPLIIPTPSDSLAVSTSSGNVAGITSAKPSPAPQITNIALYNGTNIKGLTDTFEKELSEKVKNIKVVAKSNAEKKNYAKSVVIDITGKNASLADSIAGDLGLTVSALPGDEKQPSADLLIILGSDR